MVMYKHKEYGAEGSLTSNPVSDEWNNCVDRVQDAGSGIVTKSVQISSDEVFDLSGGTGSAYLKYDSGTGRLAIFVNGSKKIEWD